MCGYYLVIYTIIAFACSGCKGQFEKEKYQASANVVINEPKSPQYHVVARDEDIAVIAKKYGMKRSTLVELNELKPPYKLFVGQKLIVVPVDYLEVAKKESSLAKNNPQLNDAKTKILPENTSNTLDESSYCFPVLGFFDKIAKEYSNLDPFVTVKCRDNEDIFCVADGVVKFVGFLDGESAQYGKAIIVKHTELQTISLYCGIDNILVKVGDNVVKGQIIATSGLTGSGATYPQLKYRIDKIVNNGTKSVNPRELIRHF